MKMLTTLIHYCFHQFNACLHFYGHILLPLVNKTESAQLALY